MTDLLVTPHTPALGSGRALRTYGVARALAEHGGLDLLYVRFGEPAPDEAFRAIRGIELHEVVPSRGARRLLAYARARRAGVPATIARGVSPELAAAAARLAQAPGRGRVIADGPVAAAALAALATRGAVVYNAHNLESGFRHELRDGAHWATEHALRRFERGLLMRASESWMVSERDLAGARELCPEARLRLVPNVVDVAAIEPPRSTSTEPRVLFVANFAYAPNRDALRFVLDEVMPRVWRELPAATLTLAGGGLQQPPSQDRRVRALGFVEDLSVAYGQARGVVVPLLQGGGTPLKLIEALAYGMPTVATTRAAAGLALRDGEHCLIADGPDAFAVALCRVLRGEDAELGSRGRALVAQRYSIEALADLLAS